MGVPALAFRVQALRRADAAAAAAAAAWTVLAVAAVAIGGTTGSLLYLGLGATALAAGLTVVLGRRSTTPVQRWAAGWACLVTAAVAGGLVVLSSPTLALVPIGVAPAAWACARWPVGALVLVFFFTGTFGSLTAFWGFPVGESVDLLLVGLWVGAAWSWIVGGRRRAAWLWPAVAVLGAYVALSTLWVAFSSESWLALQSFRASIWYIGAAFLIAFAPWPENAVPRVARGVVYVALAVGGYALLRYVIGPAEAERTLAIAAGDYNRIDGELRLVGSFPSGKELAGWSAVTAPFCLAIALGWRGRVRWAAAAATLLAAVAVFGADARTSLIALGACLVGVLGLFVISRAYGGIRLAVALGAVAVLVLGGGGAFVLTLGGERTTEDRYTVLLTPEDDPAFQARLFKWNTAIDDIEDAPLGNGMGTAGRVQAQQGRFFTVASQAIDNSYLKVAYEQGFFVMAFFIAGVLALLAGLASRAVRTTDPTRAVLALGATGSLAALAIMMAAGEYVEGLPALACWVLVGLGVAGFTARQHEPEDPAPAA